MMSFRDDSASDAARTSWQWQGFWRWSDFFGEIVGNTAVFQYFSIISTPLHLTHP